MIKRPWHGCLLPAAIRKIAIAKPNVKAKSMLYFDQSVLRILLRESEDSTRWIKLKQMLGVPIAKILVEMNFAFTPLMIWELADLVAPNPKKVVPNFRFSALSDGESIFKLFGEAKNFNLTYIDKNIDLSRRIKERAEYWQESGLKHALVKYSDIPTAQWRETIALYFAFQNLQELDLHPAGELSQLNSLIIDLGLHYREKGTNQSLYRLFHRQLVKDIANNKTKGAKADPLLTRLEDYLPDLKLHKDHVDLEYIHLSTAGDVFDGKILPVISFTFDTPDEVEKRLQLSGSAYRWIFRNKSQAGVKLTDLVYGSVVSLQENDFAIRGVSFPTKSIFQ